MVDNSQDVFDFLVNKDGEVLLLLSERTGNPEESYITLNEEDSSAIFYRNVEDELLLKDIPNNIFEDLSEVDSLLICELSNSSDKKDASISQAYEIDVK